MIRAQGEDAAAFQGVFAEALQRLQAVAGRDRVQWYDLLRVVLTWAMWRRPPTERETLLAAVQASQADAPHQQEVQSVARTIAEELIEEGRVEGRVEGELGASRTLLRILLEDRFGALPEALVSQIDGLNDLQRLQAAARQVQHLQRLDDLKL